MKRLNKSQTIVRTFFLLTFIVSYLKGYSASIPLYIGESYTINTPKAVGPDGVISNVVCTERSNNLIVVKNDDCTVTVIAGAYSSSTSHIKLIFYETYWGEYSKRNEILPHNETTYTFVTKYPKIEIPSGQSTIKLELGETRKLPYKITPEGLMEPPMNFGLSMMYPPHVDLSEDGKGYVTGYSVGRSAVIAIPYNNQKMALQWIIDVVDNDPQKIKLISDPPSGVVEAGTNVRLYSPNVSKTEIYYTMDGTTPSKSSTRYSSSLPITQSCTIKAISYKEDYTTSDILTAKYTVEQEKLTLNASPASGKISAGTYVKLTPNVTDATIYYTLDGNKPTKNSKIYSFSGIKIDESCTLKAIAYKDGYDSSDMLIESYIVELEQVKLKASPGSSEVESGTVVTLSTPNVNGATIYYTLDNTTPTTSSSQYKSSGITIDKECTLKAFAIKEGYRESDVLTEKYTIKKTLISSISLNQSTASVRAKKTIQLTASVLPKNATDQSLTWSSSNTSIATVNSNGLVTGVSEGNVTITCKANDGSNKHATCKITVLSALPSGYLLAKTAEGVELKFYVTDGDKGECKVYGTQGSPSEEQKKITKVTVPENVDGLTVVEIGSHSFHGWESLETISLPSTIKSIGAQAFYNCTSLSTITGISQVEYIGNSAFTLLSDGNIPWFDKLPDGPLYIGKTLYAYKGTMSDGTIINVKEGTTQICNWAFTNYDALSAVIIPKSVVSVGPFGKCVNLNTVKVANDNPVLDSRDNCNAVIETATNTLVSGCSGTVIPSTVKAIGSYAMQYVPITSIEIPNNIAKVAEGAFGNCSNLKKVVIGSGLKEIDSDRTFYGCDALKEISVSTANPYYDSRDNCNAIIETASDKLVIGCQNTVIPQTVMAIGEFAFWTSYEDMNSLIIPDAVTDIEREAFRCLYNLESITFGRGVKKAGDNILNFCESLKTIRVMSVMPFEITERTFDSDYNSGTRFYDEVALLVPMGSKDSYTGSSWKKFKNIVEVKTGYFTAKTAEGVELKFYGYSDGTCYLSGVSSTSVSGKITIPSEAEGSKVVEIGYGALRGCSDITEVVIPTSVKKIGSYAFRDCSSIKSISLNNSVEYLGTNAFYGCTSLETVTGIVNLEYIGGDAFYNTPWKENLPEGQIYLGKVFYLYKGTMPDNTTFTIKNGTKAIADYAFRNCKGLVSVSIPESVNKISGAAFYNCDNLGEITVAPGNPTYDSRNNCNAVVETSTNTIVAGCKNTTITSSIKSIGDDAFYSNGGLTSIVIPNNVESIGGTAFWYCNNLNSIVIGNGLKNVSNTAFWYCSALKEIVIVQDNPYYDSRENCNAIINSSTNELVIGCQSTVIPSSVKTIGEYSFMGNKSISHFVIPNTIEKIGRWAFYQQENLKTIVIGSGVKEIGEEAFSRCAKLEEVYSLNDYPFEINENVFETTSWENISIYDNATLYVPVGSKVNYMTTPGWYKFKNIQEFDTSTFDPSTLGIQNVTVDNDNDAQFYDLLGRRMKSPNKGMFIYKGKKVIVK